MTTKTTVDSINQAVAEVAARLMKHGRFNVADIVSCVRAEHSVLVARQERHLADRSIMAQAKLWLRQLDVDDEDGDVPTLALGLPRAIAVPEDDGNGFYYIAAENATWAELFAGREQRQVNKIRAEAALQAFETEMARVQPLMEADLTLTYGEACELLDS